MSTKKLGSAFVVIGVFTIIASLVVDYVGLGDERMGSSQLLRILGGIIVSLIGIPLACLSTDEKIDLQKGIRICIAGILNWPVSVWVVSGF